MTRVSRNALVPYRAAEMYGLINDIEAYPQFLPWCRAARVLAQDEHEQTAVIEFAKGAVHKSFTTRNSLRPPAHIAVHLVEGPFRNLSGAWHFIDLDGQGCKVALDMEFEFGNPLLARLVGPVFHGIANSLVDAFLRRAIDVYGRR